MANMAAIARPLGSIRLAPGCIVPPLAAILRARIPAIACGFEDADGLDRLRTAQAPRCVSHQSRR
jgi:hypothetical protein